MTYDDLRRLAVEVRAAPAALTPTLAAPVASPGLVVTPIVAAALTRAAGEFGTADGQAGIEHVCRTYLAIPNPVAPTEEIEPVGA